MPATLMIIALQVLLHKRLLFLEGPQSEQISITMESGPEPFQMLRDNLESINIQILEVKTQKARVIRSHWSSSCVWISLYPYVFSG